jgi:isopentenyl diphosphate isomerase/L-lactate dehydrogenase-like FMN-dependent dehydrogenase
VQAASAFVKSSWPSGKPRTGNNRAGLAAGSAGDEVTVRENRAAYERIAVLPRVLVDVSTREMGTTVLGQTVSMPILQSAKWHQRSLRVTEQGGHTNFDAR